MVRAIPSYRRLSKERQPPMDLLAGPWVHISAHEAMFQLLLLLMMMQQRIEPWVISIYSCSQQSPAPVVHRGITLLSTPPPVGDGALLEAVAAPVSVILGVAELWWMLQVSAST